MKYRLYIDETGTDDLTHVADPEHRYLCLTGVIMSLDHVEAFATPQMNEIKAKHCPIVVSDPDEAPKPHVLHRKDIVQAKGVFGRIVDKVAFDQELLQYLAQVDYKVISVVLDKEAMLKQRHWVEKNPYHYCMQILVEKYAQWLRRMSAQGDIMAEKRHGKKDAALERAFEGVFKDGTQYTPSALIQERLTAKTLKLRSKHENITGLQIADLIAHPICGYIRALRRGEDEAALKLFGKLIIENLLNNNKFDKGTYGALWGYGIKYLP